MNVPAAKARATFPDLVSRVAYGGERVVITKSGKPAAVLVSVADLALLERLEDAEDVALARKRLREPRVPYKALREKLGLKK